MTILQIQIRFDTDAEINTIVQCIMPANAAALMPPSLEPVGQNIMISISMQVSMKLDG